MKVEVVREQTTAGLITSQGTRSTLQGLALPSPVVGTAVLVDEGVAVAVVGHSERVTVDTHENKNHPEFAAVLKQLAYVVSLSNLVGHRNAGGDFVIVSNRLKTIALERKTWADLISSLLDGRLQAGIERMAEHYDECWLIIEGTSPPMDTQGVYWIAGHDTGVTDTRLWGALQSYQSVFGLYITCREDPIRVGVALLKLWEQHHSVNTENGARRRPIRRVTNSSPFDKAFAGLPGFSPRICKQLSGAFTSPVEAIEATAETLATIPGIGPAKIAVLKEVFIGNRKRKRRQHVAAARAANPQVSPATKGRPATNRTRATVAAQGLQRPKAVHGVRRLQAKAHH